MAKKTITVNVTVENYELAKKYIDNMSQAVDEFLAKLVMRKQKEVNGIDIELEQIEIKKIEKKISELAADLKSRVLTVEKAKEIEAQQRKEILEKEKEEIEAQGRCSNCGSVHGQEYSWKHFGEIRICAACFHTASGQQVKKWIAEAKK